ncbi:hypothetical protein CYY_005207 [Polysphondylium violaceum]|uniref:Uncharacterized protein n=1 Tax=Polysphondylium violaceum TaxID=133409 RepID=A0A8J4UZT2_9MYCE|nr:hypothetical protein CYY_005207 [Polysphondylium violaceum]
MKSINLLLLVVFLFGIQTSLVAGDYITVVPYHANDTSCAKVPYGTGSVVPLDTCIDVFGYYSIASLDTASNKIKLDYYVGNCTDSPISTNVYPMNECTEIELATGSNYYATFVSGDAAPSNSVEYTYYYYSYYCSGPTFSVFFTDNYSTPSNRFECVNGEPIVYVCDPNTNKCDALEVKGCHNQDDITPYRVDCTK